VTGIFAVLLTAVLVLVVLRSMRMIIAFFYIRQQKVDKARTWLNRINPDHLWKNQKGYYYFLMGSVDIQTNSLAQSEKFFRTALQHGLRLDHDRAAVYLNLSRGTSRCCTCCNLPSNSRLFRCESLETCW
jgi:hypothetical protein